ncbi:uncharacterized protein LOC128962425 [Oppia nitens]|uniref:uncharacterized protein LOC128962425 n=1 Tax=Oppia nitens TaxID=1686743 RepID=UPI0023DBD00B|nr:uncharacterized protein LOC128962425 [Oppia nitens]XP_054164775.1 uncharacterized protein LOC128962425 [Oppia nitens]
MPAEVVSTHVQKSPPNYSGSFAIKTKVESVPIGEELRLNLSYFTTIPGILKLVQLVIAIVCMACISPPLAWFARLFTAVVSLSFALTLILCFCYLVTLKNIVFPKFDWIFAELIYSAIVTISLFITSIIHLSMTARADYRYALTHYSSYLGTSFFGTYIAAGVFGLLNFFAYGAGTAFLFLEWKGDRNGNTVSPATNGRS